MNGTARIWTQAFRCQGPYHVQNCCCPCASALKGTAPSGQGFWEPLSTPREVNFGNKKGARTGQELLGSFSRAEEMSPIPGPLGEGEETAAYSSGCGKVTGEKAAIVCHWRVGAGSLSPRTLCSAQAPAPSQEALSWGREPGALPRP